MATFENSADYIIFTITFIYNYDIIWSINILYGFTNLYIYSERASSLRSKKQKDHDSDAILTTPFHFIRPSRLVGVSLLKTDGGKFPNLWDVC